MVGGDDCWLWGAGTAQRFCNQSKYVYMDELARGHGVAESETAVLCVLSTTESNKALLDELGGQAGR